MEENYTLIYVNVDDEGNIKPGYIAGIRAFPTEDYNFFFRVREDEIEIDSLVSKYKVIIDGYKPKLVHK